MEKNSGGWGKTIIEKYKLVGGSSTLEEKSIVDINVHQNLIANNTEKDDYKASSDDVNTVDKTTHCEKNIVENNQSTMDDKWNIALYLDEFRRKRLSITEEKRVMEGEIHDENQDVIPKKI